MPRKKQIPRMSTGGKAPRKILATMAARKSAPPAESAEQQQAQNLKKETNQEGKNPDINNTTQSTEAIISSTSKDDS
ncbi:unnamed protein product [Rotaria sp. Silwood1]|nr:unnamed protein product [Rotaria sp. Silwood1]CAF1387534.1 unnamed protein product [Rotaria sp. Silwood1]CAF1584620.1 unnamed protein product [Rotaria sp. Silwood1]CAF1585400.1 unnamed protein product [Rotaria sp. Silwood1]CAF1658874.1 unnamed protein product [Rotaria sp. Silwood1]